MEIIFWIFIFLCTFSIMEFMAWFTHKYVMHGFLWSLHKDHHHKDHGSWWERNDLFFIFYAAISISCFIAWSYFGFWAGLPIGLGIFFMGQDTLLCTIFLFINDLNTSEMQIIGMQKGFAEHIKCIINIQGKLKVSALECQCPP